MISVILLIFFVSAKGIYVRDDITTKPPYEIWNNYEQRNKNETVIMHHNYSRVNIHTTKSVVKEGNQNNQQIIENSNIYAVSINAMDKEEIPKSKLSFKENIREFEKNENYLDDGNNIPSKNIKTYSNMAFENCPKDANGPVAYLWSCNQFLNCWRGRGIIQNCAPGTKFNPILLECDYEDKVDCISGPRNQKVTFEIHVSQEYSQLCPPNFSGFLTYSQDCSKFIHCTFDNSFIQECAPGTYFNSVIQACDHPLRSDCILNNEKNHKSSNYNKFIDQKENVFKTQYCPNCLRNHTSNNSFDRSADSSITANCQSNCKFEEKHFQNKSNYQKFPFVIQEYQQKCQLKNCNVISFASQKRNCAFNNCGSQQVTPNFPKDTHEIFPHINKENCQNGHCGPQQIVPNYPKGAHQILPNTRKQNCHGNCEPQQIVPNFPQDAHQILPDNRKQNCHGNCGPQQIVPNYPPDIHQILQHNNKENCHNGNCAPQQIVPNYPQGAHQILPDNRKQNCHGNCEPQQIVPTYPQGAYQILPDNRKQNCHGNCGPQQIVPTYPQGAYQILPDNRKQNCHGNCAPQQIVPTYPQGAHEILSNNRKQNCHGNCGPQQIVPTYLQGAHQILPDNRKQNCHGNCGPQQIVPNYLQGTHQILQHNNKEDCHNGNCGPQQIVPNYPQGIHEILQHNNKDCHNGNCAPQQIIPNYPQGTHQILQHNYNKENCNYGKCTTQQNHEHLKFNSEFVEQRKAYVYNNNHGMRQSEVNKNEQLQSARNLEIPNKQIELCPSGYSGLMPHQEFCDKFINCANGQVFVQTCGPGTVFNPKIKACDWPHNVICGSHKTENIHKGRDFEHYQMSEKLQIHTNKNKTNTNFMRNQNDKFFDQYNLHKNNSNSQFKSNKGQPTIIEPIDPIVLNISLNVHNSSTSKPINIFPSTDVNADYYFEDSSNESVMKQCPKGNFACSKNECIPKAWVCDGSPDCNNGFDEQQCDIYTSNFTAIPHKRLFKSEIEKWINTSVNTCAMYCLNSKTFICKSFNHRKDENICLLSDTNAGLSGALLPSYIYDYYEFKNLSINCTNKYICSNNKCINISQLCNGEDDCGNREDEKNCSIDAIGYRIKLSRSTLPEEGLIEIKVFNKWGYICDDGFGLRNADVACKELGFPLGAVEVKPGSYFLTDIPNNTFFMMDDVHCLGNETSLRDCDFNGWGIHNCKPEEIIGVVCKISTNTCPQGQWKCDTTNECLPLAFVCDGIVDCQDRSDEGVQHCDAPIEIRLMNGTSKLEGRVEVRYHGVWGTVCDDDFNDKTASVICKSLGYYGSAFAKKDGAFGPGVGPIWLDQLNCFGNESSIDVCFHWNWGEHNCDHNEDAGVICTLDYEKRSKDKTLIIEHDVSLLNENQLYNEKCGFTGVDLLPNESNESDEVHFRVVKGSEAKRGEYPWQATIRVKGKLQSSHWCGAVIISKKFALTAAHCLVGFAKGAYVVRAGDYNVDEHEGTEVEAYIEDFYIHEQFRQGGHMNNDIALIKLKGSGIQFSKNVQPICLPSKNSVYKPGLNCTISGFGSTETGKSTSSRILRAGWITIQPQNVCKMPQVYGDAITNGMFCAGSLDEGVDSCDGDSGGPLACLENGLFTLYGITSWGQRCGHINKPGVYVKVSQYIDWIEEISNKLS